MSDLVELFARAVSLELNGQTVAAIEVYRRVLTADPSDGAAHAGIGYAFCALSWVDFDRGCWLIKACDEFKAAGNAFFDRKSYGEALKMYNLILDLRGSDAESHFNIGRVYHRIGKLDSALEQYKMAASQNPRDFRYHNNIGALYAERKCYMEAIKHYEIALHINPKDTATLYNLGLEYYNLERFDEAITTYKTLLELCPNDGTAHYNIACAHYHLKNYELCIRHAKTAKSLGMNSQKVDHLLGLLPPSLSANFSE